MNDEAPVLNISALAWTDYATLVISCSKCGDLSYDSCATASDLYERQAQHIRSTHPEHDTP